MSFVGQHDVQLVHAIERRCAATTDDDQDVPEEAKMKAYEDLDHDTVVDNLRTTSKARRTAQVAMAEEGYQLSSGKPYDRQGKDKTRRFDNSHRPIIKSRASQPS